MCCAPDCNVATWCLRGSTGAGGRRRQKPIEGAIGELVDGGKPALPEQHFRAVDALLGGLSGALTAASEPVACAIAGERAALRYSARALLGWLPRVAHEPGARLCSHFAA